jgi:hypothetical protein
MQVFEEGTMEIPTGGRGHSNSNHFADGTETSLVIVGIFLSNVNISTRQLFVNDVRAIQTIRPQSRIHYLLGDDNLSTYKKAFSCPMLISVVI